MNGIVDKIIKTDRRSIEDVFSGKGSVYTFFNPVSYLDGRKHKDLYGQFDGLFADGSLLVHAIRVLHFKKVKRRSFDMTSLAPMLLQFAADHSKSVYLIGAEPGKAEVAKAFFEKKFKGLNIVGCRNGFFSNDDDRNQAIQDILDAHPDFVIVGMGSVIQDRFLLDLKKKGFEGVGFSCGGFIHQVAMGGENLCYYPKWVNKLGLRFAYRMVKESHTRKRYLKAAFLFPLGFLHDRIFG